MCELGDLITDICGVEYQRMKKSQSQMIKSYAQVKPLADPVWFVNTPKYEDTVTQNICTFFTNLFKYIVGDASEVESELGYGSNKSGSSRKSRKNRSSSGKLDSDDSEESGDATMRDPIMIVIDNA